MKQVLFIINPNSGTKKTENIKNAIMQRINNDIFNVSITYTEYAGHAVVISKEAVLNKTDLIVAVGGDGTVNEVASQIVNTDTGLGIVPLGSGNGLARHLRIPLNIEKSIELINNFNFSKIDTGTVNEVFFVSIAGIGFDALIADKFAKGRQRGFVGYFKLIASEYFKYKPQKYIISFENKEQIEKQALFVAFANSNQFGFNTTIAPNARLQDGLLDVCIVEKPKIYSLPVIANLLMLKLIEKSPQVQIVKANNVKIIRESEGTVNIDGEPILMQDKLEIKLNPLSLKIILDKNVSEI
jgi:YegS/Rv2252/BmrU family lipid kinase